MTDQADNPHSSSPAAEPLALRLSAGLGPLPEETLRQQAFVILSRLQSGTEDVVRLDTALAALAAERERCAKVCESLTLEHPGRADLTADQCAAAIRGLAA